MLETPAMKLLLVLPSHSSDIDLELFNPPSLKKILSAIESLYSIFFITTSFVHPQYVIGLTSSYLSIIFILLFIFYKCSFLLTCQSSSFADTSLPLTNMFFVENFQMNFFDRSSIYFINYY